MGLAFNGVCGNVGHSDFEKKNQINIAFGQGLFTLTHNGKTTWRLFHGKQKEQVRLLKCILDSLLLS